MSMDSYLLDAKERLSIILPSLNEKQKRIAAAAEALILGHGGISKIAKITGMSRNTIRRGVLEFEEGETDCTKIRKKGGGRKKKEDIEPKIINEIKKLIDSDTFGDPESPLLWTCKSLRLISAALKKKGHSVNHSTIARLLKGMNYSLQSNKKSKEGKDHPDRDEQFKFISKACKIFMVKNDPVISVDTKKKELVGNYKNAGREWRKSKNPIEVKTHDFPEKKKKGEKGNGKASPYGIYDIGDNSGFVNVGITSDTAEFAVASINYWWRYVGKKKYPKSKRILICADSGGSNSYRSRLWKTEIQKFANKTGMQVSVKHFPRGTSKWNKIEHKLFSFITINWRGRPLRTYQTIVQLIASTKNSTGLTVKSRLDKKTYMKGIKIPDEEMEKLNIKKDKFHGEWNYTIRPQRY